MQQMRIRIVLLQVVLVLGFMCLQPAFAQSDPFGLYVGLGIGRSTLGNSFSVVNPYDATPFAQSELGFKGLIGVRPIPWVGAELEYIDFGTSRAGTEAAAIVDGVNNGQFLGGSAAERAGALFAVGYLPLPPGWPEFFGKVGLARLWGRYSYTGDYNLATPAGTTYSTVYTAQTADSRGLALGAGVQVPLGGMSVRAEYERVKGSENDGLREKPTLVSASVIWSF
jgi:Outer membrane protein beta-barrel domain